MDIIAENLRRIRASRGLSQDQLADRVGTTQTTIDKIERGLTKRSRFLPEIARVLAVELHDINPALRRTDETAVIPRADLIGAKDLPIYSATEGGEGTIVIGNDPIDYVRRPAPLVHVREGYGVVVVGDSMIPVFRPGDIALVHPNLPPKAEDACVFQGSTPLGVISTIKEYVSATPAQWRVKRYRPEESEFRLGRDSWPTCHVVVGRYSRR